ncbi:hypothetical protein NQ315_012594 [Exocentrus adspersus]|uniref:Uncharacterized protein n=1 Tax=Exocentrus adspersus TaxID=1586481 RepID=A0AAV8VSJ6_9CUCU|nr:hypothetical protein NQ315_012594 [Exocentrus adspersus]
MELMFKYKVEHTFYVEEGKTVNKFPVQNIAVEAEESWDYLNATSYDPNKYCESTGVLRHLDVASAATRKNFRMEERHRLSQLNSSSNNTARLVQPDSNQSTARNTVPGLRRNLPDIPNATTVEENTPELVNELIKRLNLGKNKSFIPKTRVGQ